MSFFQTPEEIEKEFSVVPKVPYTFKYVFEDEVGKQSKMMIEDWETGMLYFNCLKSTEGDEAAAILKVREMYYDKFIARDLHFFLGTSLKFHNVGLNPFFIIGTFHPPLPSPVHQLSLFDE